jgi:hypothetical protein
MARPATQAPATRRWHQPGAPPREGAPANIRRGDTASVLPPRPHGAAASHSPVTVLAAPAVSQRPP